MKTFQVTMKLRGELVIRVEADTERQARLRAQLYFSDRKPTQEASLIREEQWIQSSDVEGAR